MKKLLIIAAMAATAVACTPKTAPELPMETFFRNSEKSDYQISPDGKYFSYMAPLGEPPQHLRTAGRVG